MENENYGERVKRINEKLKDESLKNEMNQLISRIEEIVENEIEISMIFNPSFDDYHKTLDSYAEEEDFNFISDKCLPLKSFIKLIDDKADYDLKVFIDPIRLNNGLNEIVDCLVTTLDDKIILVPETKKNNENGE